MSWWRNALSGLSSLSRRCEEDLDRELSADLELEAEERRDSGASAVEAAHAARRAFGNVTRAKEEVREAWGWSGITAVSQDLCYGLRTLCRTPRFTALAVFLLGLGIGGNTAIFSVVNAVLVTPLPYPDSGRLVKLWESNPRANRWGHWVSYPDYLDYRRQNQVFEDVASFRRWSWTITGGDYPEAISGLLVSSNLFSTLGVEPMLGRSFLADEDQPGQAPVVILGHVLWQNRFESDPAVIGQEVTIDGQGHTIVGVMPREFQFPVDIFESDNPPGMFIPVGAFPERTQRGSHNFRVLARIQTDASVEQAQAAMAPIAAAIGEEDPEHRGRDIQVAGLLRTATSQVRPALLLLLGAIGFVLLIACANVANLQLARATARQRESAIRQALGASRTRLVRQLLTESTLVALLGGAWGLALASLGIRFLVRLGPAIPRLRETTMDPLVIGFALALSLFSGILFGLAPAFRASKTNLSLGLNEAGTRSTAGASGVRMRNLLVIAEMALALMVLLCAGLLIRSFLLLQNANLGFDPRNVVTASLRASEDIGPADQVAFFREVIARMEAMPGVVAAGAASAAPLRGNDNGPFRIEGQPQRQLGDPVVYAERPRITPGYFRAMQIDLLKGREFTWADDENAASVAIINDTLARQYWPAEDPIGHRLSIDDRDGQPVWRQVVGIVRDTKYDDVAAQMRPIIYVPLPQAPRSSLVLAIRVQADPLSLAEPFRQAVTGVRPDRPLFAIETMEQVIANSLSNRRFQTFLLGAFATIALTLAAVGIYAVVSYSVTQRTQEIGIRMALGACQRDMLRRVLGEGMSMALSGAVIGLAVSLPLCSGLSGILFGVSSWDPLTFVAVPALLLGVALVAVYVPARRATRVDPMIALRHE